MQAHTGVGGIAPVNHKEAGEAWQAAALLGGLRGGGSRHVEEGA